MFYELFRTAKTREEFETLLQITFTEHEIALIRERWLIFEALDRGLSQREVSREVPCSIVTATRGAKVFRENKAKIQAFLPAVRRFFKTEKP